MCDTMDWSGGKAIPLILVVLILAVGSSFFLAQNQGPITGQVISVQATSASCWSYTTSPTCTAYSNCQWKNDSWSGWCQELNCWSLYNQSECTGTPIEGKNCSWKPGTTNYNCEDVSCWSFTGTNQSACESNAQGLNCEWRGECYTNIWTQGINCWEKSSSNECLNATGCAWGQCMSKGCWSYSTNATCSAAKDWQGRNCTWLNETWGSYCSENGCWRQATNTSKTSSERQTLCESAQGMNCTWKWDYCNEVDCWTWDSTNRTACEENSYGLSCQWNQWSTSQGSCSKKGCWNYNAQECASQSKCTLRAYYSSGYCQEVQCWNWDGWNGGTEYLCTHNPYSMSCAWSSWTGGGGNSTGSCYPSTTKTCSNMSTDRECMDTMYCWWQYTNPANPSAGGLCKDPSNFSLATNTSIFNEWNPSCYIFDNNATVCNKTIGCNHTAGVGCSPIAGHAFEGVINTSGINCTMINDTSLCSSISVLSSCCTWRNGSCQTDRMTTSCWSQMQQKTEKSCEDASTKTRCDEIANFPWFMPCSWSGDNTTGTCSFKASNVFGNKTQTLLSIDNKKSCEAASGKWITENYCEGTVSVPAGRCEQKFDEEDNCDKACFACERKDSNGATVNASNAKTACEGSGLGFCEFVANANAPNGGFCKAKEQFKKGTASSCDTNCGDCMFMGDKNSSLTEKRPDYICNTRKADANGETCKWDNTTQTCVKKSDKICKDSCDRCTTRWDCQNIGRTAMANQSGSCKWSGDDNAGTCDSNTGKATETCWDGIDNDNNTLTDCADPACYSDSFCGFSSGCPDSSKGNDTCINAGCDWVTDNWGSWCDVKGSQCWKYGQNSTVCDAQSSCQWGSGAGSAWCERDTSTQESCMSKTKVQCTSPCNWTVDSWCQGQGNSTPWCQTNGGWCDHPDFKPKDCWMYTSGSTQCNDQSGCSWHTDQYALPHCEVNYSANCWNFTTSSSCSASGCWWKADSWGSWCTNMMDKCWSAMNSTSCAAQTSGGSNICYWENWGGGTGGSCQSLCYNGSYNNNAGCSSVPGCVWKEQNGWCEESMMSSCSSKSTSDSCTQTSGCKWKSAGWCEPKGGGFSVAAGAGGGGAGGAMGAAECFKYDGNETACRNKSVRTDNLNISCGWMPEASPRCEVNWSANCWSYIASDDCTAAGCWWKSDSYGSWCMNTMDQCMSNMSLQTQATCNQNTLCNWTGWSCQPMCNSKTTANACTAGGLSGKCRWINGWCNPSGMTDMFNGMEAGAPVPIGFDMCPEAGKQASVDICGFGMKDMGDAYGFGMGVQDFSNASVCNKEKLSPFVMGGGGKMEGGSGGGVGGGGGGFGTTFGEERTGSGNETVIFIVYLDTDGQTTGGCTLNHDSSATGYEFMFKYSSVWSANTSKAVETFNAYKCEGGAWKATDIKLSVWKKMMCSEIGGPMIAVNKGDLSKYTSLYNSSKDMRIAVASIGNTGNNTDPTDTAGPGWTTPGSVDFTISDVFSYGANMALFEDIMKKGFVVGEDCFNNIDDDNDGSMDCNDWDCQFAPRCASSGVNTQEDTRSPQVTGVKIEEYPDAALIMYDTNKPTNGTLELYGADSRCTNRTDVIYDIGILKSSTVRQYKPWHGAEIYYDGNPADNISINYPLANGVTYYYKLKVCDSKGKCAISRCSNFTTPSTQSDCSYCSFVTRIAAPSGWDVYYDLDQDGSYEHWQGHVCGPQAGMKANYTDGRKANIKLMLSDNSTYFEFINVTLTKTGLNDKVRTISGSGAIIRDTTKGTIGLQSETRDKIINNMHPEVCLLKISTTGACTKLYHCDDNGNNCTDRTAEAGGAPVNAANCVWRVPYCEFSTYKTSAPTTPGGGDGGGGGGGGGSSASTITVTAEQLAAGYTYELAAKDKFKLTIGTEVHYVAVHSLTATTATINVSSTTVQATLSIGVAKSFELTNDSYYDISVKLNSINTTSNKTSLTVKSIHELIPGGAATPTGPAGETGGTGTDGTGTSGAPTTGQPGQLGQLDASLLLPIALVIIIIAAIAAIVILRRKK